MHLPGVHLSQHNSKHLSTNSVVDDDEISDSHSSAHVVDVQNPSRLYRRSNSSDSIYSAQLKLELSNGSSTESSPVTTPTSTSTAAASCTAGIVSHKNCIGTDTTASSSKSGQQPRRQDIRRTPAPRDAADSVDHNSSFAAFDIVQPSTTLPQNTMHLLGASLLDTNIGGDPFSATAVHTVNSSSLPLGHPPALASQLHAMSVNSAHVMRHHHWPPQSAHQFPPHVGHGLYFHGPQRMPPLHESSMKHAVDRTAAMDHMPQSGFKGVSWNSRMKAWLAFYITETGGRKSKTFSTRKLGMEEARLQAILFCKEKQDARRDARRRYREDTVKLHSQIALPGELPGNRVGGSTGSMDMYFDDRLSGSGCHVPVSNGSVSSSSPSNFDNTNQLAGLGDLHSSDIPHDDVAGDGAYVPVVPLQLDRLLKCGSMEPLELTVLPPCQHCMKQPYPLLMLVAEGKGKLSNEDEPAPCSTQNPSEPVLFVHPDNSNGSPKK